jgi:hypothetical protein
MRATGAMSLITARIDSDLIRLLGRWQSDSMLRYLHVQAISVLQNFARQFQALLDAGLPLHQPQLRSVPSPFFSGLTARVRWDELSQSWSVPRCLRRA